MSLTYIGVIIGGETISSEITEKETFYGEITYEVENVFGKWRGTKATS